MKRCPSAPWSGTPLDSGTADGGHADAQRAAGRRLRQGEVVGQGSGHAERGAAAEQARGG